MGGRGEEKRAVWSTAHYTALLREGGGMEDEKEEEDKVRGMGKV
jgi:hypothetical protein